MWTEFIWLRTRTGGGRFWTRQWTYRFHKMLEISWKLSVLCFSRRTKLHQLVIHSLFLTFSVPFAFCKINLFISLPVDPRLPLVDSIGGEFHLSTHSLIFLGWWIGPNPLAFTYTVQNRTRLERCCLWSTLKIPKVFFTPQNGRWRQPVASLTTTAQRNCGLRSLFRKE
jgi:hypothetical protein